MPNYIQHLRGLSKPELESEIHNRIADKYLELIHEDAVSAAISETNASGFMMDTYEIEESTDSLDLSGEFVDLPISSQARGDSDPDKAYSGDRINVEATARIDDDGAVEFRDVEARVDRSDEGE